MQAVDSVNFDVHRGETLALVGESGCGKSTLARTILQLNRPTSGSVRFEGTELTDLSDREVRPLRENMQMIFQDPHASLNPRVTVGRIVTEPMKAHDLYDPETRLERAKVLLEKVGLAASHVSRHPHEFSGGQRQRINLARALSTDPDLVICDEPVSALDVSIQAQVLNTMRDLQAEFGVTYLFISHDLSVVRYIADRVAVMYLGHVVELAEKEELFENPQHPYTRALLDAIPVPDPRETSVRGRLAGDVPDPIDPPSGCRFRTRCPELVQPGTADVEMDGLTESAREHRLSTYGMDQDTWHAVLAFTRAVRRRNFTFDEVDVEAAFFPDGRPAGEVGDVIADAIAHLRADEWDEATDLLSSSFEENSVCSACRPSYEVDPELGDHRHTVACHLVRE